MFCPLLAACAFSSVTCGRVATIQHGLGCFARLVRVLLGPDAVEESKLGWGKQLCILGVDLQLSSRGFTFTPAEDKCKRWIADIDAALADCRLLPGSASKLAGRLSWGCSQLFHRLGRAMLRPVFDQKSRRDGDVSPELRRSLHWWRSILEMRISELRSWQQNVDQPAHLFCDAAGSPPHLGAVLCVDSCWYWTHSDAPKNVLAKFTHRKDNQIMGLELLSISLGFATFAELIRRKRVVVHSDNTGSEVPGGAPGVNALGVCFVLQACIRRGSARFMDHAQLVHSQWTTAALLGLNLFIKRVDTNDNIADLPSRGVRLCVLPFSLRSVGVIISAGFLTV